MSIFLSKTYNRKPSQIREGFTDSDNIRARILHELEINGKNVDEDDDFTMKDDSNDKAENGEESPQDAANNAADTQGDESDDNFTLTDQDTSEEGDDASANNQEQGGDANDSNDATTDNQDSGEEIQSDNDNAGSDQSDDNFTLNDSDVPEDGGETSEGDGSQDTSGGNAEADGANGAADAGADNTDNASGADKSLSDEEITSAEEQIYDSLTDEQRRIRTLQLKIDYRDLYDTFMNSIDGINGIPKSNDNILIIQRLIDYLTRAKSILIDYIQNNFDGSAYMNNYVNYIKFLAIFRTCTKVVDYLSKTDK